MRKMFQSKRGRVNEEMSLNITSMADIFTILLVFLLKSYAGGAVTISPSASTILPQAQAATPAVDALKVEVAQGTVSIEGAPIVQLNGYAFPPGDLQGNGTSQALVKAFERERQKQLMIAKVNSEVKVDPKIILVADQKVPYGLLKSVLASAAVHGYTDFKLAVVSRE